MDKVHIYEDSQGLWRWRRQSENGKIVSQSSEGYTSYAHTKVMAVELNQDCDLVEPPDEA